MTTRLDLFIDRMYGKNLKSAISKDEFLTCIGGSRFGALFGSLGSVNMMGSMKGGTADEGEDNEETKGGEDKKKKEREKKKEKLDPDTRMWQEIQDNPDSATWLFSPKKV